MKIQIRSGLFETNSSSVHSLVMVSGNDFEKWKNGELVYDRMRDKLIPVTDEEYLEWKKENEEEDPEWYDYLTFDEFFDYDTLEYETFEDSFTTEKGDVVKVFGYYGYNG